MLQPQLIDRLNQRNTEAIRRLETMHQHIQQLERMIDTLSGVVVDIIPTGASGFAIVADLPAHWHTHQNELALLLHDYSYYTPTQSLNRTDACTMHRHAGISLTLRIATPYPQEVAA